ncbi:MULTISPECIES: ABC transporter ATP-binding protein [unclassified Clostridium]|uniref:ABC transporter ATP-binding protein n=1 Tax=unclassified Clostridium TaxID=2614128 RepID=UPI0025BB130E|nr:MULTISPECIES: ABC transporter ATP-binding protein [unclassified Clostridium]
MKKILSYTKNYKLITLIGALAMIIIIGVDLVTPYITKLFIDDVIVKGNYEILGMLLKGIAVIAFTKFIFGYVKEFMFDYLGRKVAGDLKQNLFDHIQSLSFSYFDNMNTGELMSRVGEDVDNIWGVMGFGMRLFIENIVYFVLSTVILLRMNVLLTVIALITMPVIAFITVKLEKQLDSVFEKISDHTAVLNTTAQENIAGVKLVKAFAREKHEILKFLKFNDKNYDLAVQKSKIWGKFYPIEEFLGNLSVLLVNGVGGILVIKGTLTVGELVAFNGYLWLLIWPMRMLGWLTNMLSQTKASQKKIDAILAIEPEVKNSEDAIVLEDIKGDISFENVIFKYKEKPVLRGINLDIKAGSTVAIMGATGSGKSSLISLLLRNYDVMEGSVKIDGCDVKDIDVHSLRKSISIVPQDSFLFSDTIENNIRYGKESATIEEIEKVLELACAKEFVDELEEGLETLIGERGLGLSGGQKQRLCIARALIRKCSILILDDSTSALDMETEHDLLKNLYHSEKKITTFIVAHRISAVKNADLIIYMDEGEIVEYGTHESLLKKGGKYYEIYKTQFKDFINSEKRNEEVS